MKAQQLFSEMAERTTANDQEAAEKAAKMEYLKREYRDCKAQLIAAF